MPIAGKFGKLPPDPAKPKLSVATLLPQAAAAPVPTVVDYVSLINEWPMYHNDKIGNCTCAGAGHVIQAATTYGQGHTITLPGDAIDDAYKAVSGYDPSDPSTDQGAVLQSVLDYWRKSGIGDNKILAFAAVDFHNPAEMAAALYYFGHLLIGFEVRQLALDQFNSGETWHVASPEGRSLGGHCVSIGYDSVDDEIKRCVTWGTTQVMSNAFLEKYCDEAWVIVTRDWVNEITQITPVGMALTAFGAEFTHLTGQPSPFHEEPPVPETGPTGPTGPTGVVAPPTTEAELAAVLTKWLGKKWCKPNKASAAVIRAWLAEKGY